MPLDGFTPMFTIKVKPEWATKRHGHSHQRQGFQCNYSAKSGGGELVILQCNVASVPCTRRVYYSTVSANAAPTLSGS